MGTNSHSSVPFSLRCVFKDDLFASSRANVLYLCTHHEMH